MSVDGFVDGLTLWRGRPVNVSAWSDLGACRGMDSDVFFPGRGDSTQLGKRVCAECEVRAACLEAALANGEVYGIWGGTSEADRRQIRRERRAA